MSYGPPNDPNQQGQPDNQPAQGYQPPAQGYQPPPQGYQQPQGNQPPSYPAQGYQPPATQMPNANQLVAGFKNYSLGRRVATGAGAFAVLMFFLPWYVFEIETGFGSALAAGDSASGLRGLPMLAFLVLLALVVMLVLPLFGKRLNQFVNLRFPEGMLTFFGAAGVFVVSLVGGMIVKSANTVDLPGFETSFGIGYWLAILALAVMTAGGWLMHQARE